MCLHIRQHSYLRHIIFLTCAFLSANILPHIGYSLSYQVACESQRNLVILHFSHPTLMWWLVYHIIINFLIILYLWSWIIKVISFWNYIQASVYVHSCFILHIFETTFHLRLLSLLVQKHLDCNAILHCSSLSIELYIILEHTSTFLWTLLFFHR